MEMEHISMDFVVDFSKSIKGNNAIWIIVDRLTKTFHFMPVKMTFIVDQLAQQYIKDIVKLHGVLVSIVSDRDSRLTTKFWKSLHEVLGKKLNFSIAYHPQLDGQSKRTIQKLEDMLRAFV